MPLYRAFAANRSGHRFNGRQQFYGTFTGTRGTEVFLLTFISIFGKYVNIFLKKLYTMFDNLDNNWRGLRR